MYVDISDRSIRIERGDLLESHHRSQLSFWGFKQSKEHSCLCFVSENPSAELLAVVTEYLSDEGIHFELSRAAQQLLDQERQRAFHFNELKDRAARFKAGDYDTALYKEFQDFIASRVPRRLKPHQLKAAFHLSLVGNGANFSVPGSGKTAVVLAVYEKLRDEGKANFLFVIGPPSCFGPWKDEFIETLGRTPNVRVLVGGDKETRKNEYYRPRSSADELYLTTFQSATNDVQQIQTLFNLAGSKAFLVVDEAHYIKQLGGVWAGAVLEIAPLAVARCVLSGTPMPNSFRDVFNLFDFLWGVNQMLGSEDKVRILLAEDNRNTARAKETLKRCIGPLFYRVRKKDLGLKEQVFLPPYLIPMNTTEKLLYSAMQTKIREYSRQDYLRNIEVVNRLRRGRMTRLRQCVSYPKMLKSAIDDYDEDLIDPDSEVLHWIVDYDTLERPAKLEFLLELVGQFQQQHTKVVIWSNFVMTIDLISSTLSERGFRNKCILGRTPIEKMQLTDEETRTVLHDAETREAIRMEFLHPESGLDILIANPAACAESISLHRTCQNAVYYDLSYNCAQYLQSLDRIHRVGGSETKEAYYHFLQYESTIDQDIKSSLEAKAERMYQVINEEYTIYSLDMFEEDNEELLAYERIFK